MIKKKKGKDTNIFLMVQKWFHTFSLAKSFVIDFSVIFLGNHLYILSINTVSLSSELWGEKGRCTLMVVLLKKMSFWSGKVFNIIKFSPVLTDKEVEGREGLKLSRCTGRPAWPWWPVLCPPRSKPSWVTDEGRRPPPSLLTWYKHVNRMVGKCL